MATLRLRGLEVNYRGAAGVLPAVRGVNLDVEPGQVVGLAGESGCGKSTVAGAVLRLLPSSTVVKGEVLLDGENVLTMSWGRLRAVRWSAASIVFQGAMHALNPVRRVGGQIAEAMALHPVAPRGATSAAVPRSWGGERRAIRERVGELLEQVGLPASRADSYPHELSGGQRQRVMIAMALACSPRLILADEPTTALDVMVQAQVMALLGDLVRDRGLAMVLISHDLAVLAKECDRVAVMYAGRIVEEGPAPIVFAEPRHPYTIALAAAFPMIGDQASRRAPRGLAGDPPDPQALPRGCPFQPRCSMAISSCAEIDVRLRPVAMTGRAVACVHVADDKAGG